MRRFILPLLLLASIALSPPTTSYTRDVAISASPRFGFAPLSVRVQMTIKPDKLNRSATFIYDGPISRLSAWEINGDSPKTTWQIIQNLPAGPYVLTLIAGRADGTTQQASTRICALGSGADPTDLGCEP